MVTSNDSAGSESPRAESGSGPIESLSDAAGAATDVAWAVAKLGLRGAVLGMRATDAGIRAVAPVTKAVLDPARLPEAVRPATLLRHLGEERRADISAQAADLTGAVSGVLSAVDIPRIVNQVLDQLDLNEIVEERVDLVSMTELVIDEVDLPGIVSASTGTLASGTIRATRLKAAAADNFVSRRSSPPAVAQHGREDGAVSWLTEDARELQGRPAGPVSRLLAIVVDVCLLVVALYGIWIGWAAVSYLHRPRGFRWPAPGPFAIYLAGVALGVAYLTIGWAVSGRTAGTGLLGLRVTRADGRIPGATLALLRAAVSVAFPVTWLWIFVSRRRASVADLVARTEVRYDWVPEQSD